MSKEEGTGERGEEDDKAEGDEDQDAAPHGPRCMNPTDPATRIYCSTWAKGFLPAQPGEHRLKTKAGQQKKGKGRREAGGEPKQPRARARAAL
jgi:hypothetical protein